MSESTLPWMKPCAHAEPQGASQLHGVCIFCYRDRLSEAHRTISDIHALEKERDEWRSRVRDWCELVRPHSFSDETAEQTIARMAAAERERDEARVNAKYEHGRAEGNYEGLEAAIDRAETADQRIIELEEALSKLQSKMLLVSDIGFAGLQDLRHIISCALSPAPAQPATAAKEDE